MLRQTPDVHLHTTHTRVKEVTHHGNPVGSSSLSHHRAIVAVVLVRGSSHGCCIGGMTRSVFSSESSSPFPLSLQTLQLFVFPWSIGLISSWRSVLRVAPATSILGMLFLVRPNCWLWCEWWTRVKFSFVTCEFRFISSVTDSFIHGIQISQFFDEILWKRENLLGDFFVLSDDQMNPSPTSCTLLDEFMLANSCITSLLFTRKGLAITKTM